MAEVQALLSGLACKHLLLLLDCCFAGAFRWSPDAQHLRARPATLYRERYERYLRDPAWQVITSAASDERALDTVAGGTSDGAAPTMTTPVLQRHCAADCVARPTSPSQDIPTASSSPTSCMSLESAFSRLEHQLGRTVQKPLLWSLDGREKRTVHLPDARTPHRAALALALTEGNNPYRGLEPYDENDEARAALFFGRNEGHRTPQQTGEHRAPNRGQWRVG